MKTLIEVRDYLSNIPEDQWCIEELQNDKGHRCVVGHINYALHGSALHLSKMPALNLLTELDVDLNVLIHHNNGWIGGEEDKSPKERAINYLNSLIVD